MAGTSYTLGFCAIVFACAGWIGGTVQGWACEYDVTHNHTLGWAATMKMVKEPEEDLGLLGTCKRWCDRSTTCRSFDFNKKYWLCYLKHANKETAPEAYEQDANSDHYEKSWCSDDPLPPLPVYSEECQRGWLYYNDSCYFVQYAYEYDWKMSQSLCEDMGAHLATVHTSDELHFLGEAVNRVDFEGESGHGGEYWVGAMRPDSNHPFTWIDGTVLAEDSPLWSTNNPGYYFETAVGFKADWDLGGTKENGLMDIVWTSNGLFSKKDDAVMSYICEYEVANAAKTAVFQAGCMVLLVPLMSASYLLLDGIV